jgi:2-methylisocitrate lyase-like PEP mutase family enzyme
MTGLAAARACLRQAVFQRRAILAPGAANALTARVIEELGFEVVYVTGAGVANTSLGVPDVGLLTVTELADATAKIADAVSLPLIVDVDTGFGNAVNVGRTVRSIERAGAAAIQIEDQVFPKRCGHFDGKAVIAAAEMVGKVRAAVDARDDENLLVIARTDARAVGGLQEALDRAGAYHQAGADVTFVEAPLDAAELAAVAALAPPQVANIVIGGRTPALPQAELAALGVALVLYANAALQAALKATTEVLAHLRARGSLAGMDAKLASFEERQRVVNKSLYDELERRYRAD